MTKETTAEIQEKESSQKGQNKNKLARFRRFGVKEPFVIQRTMFLPMSSATTIVKSVELRSPTEDNIIVDLAALVLACLNGVS